MIKYYVIAYGDVIMIWFYKSRIFMSRHVMSCLKGMTLTGCRVLTKVPHDV